LELTLAAAFNAFGVLRGFCRKLGAMVGVQMIIMSRALHEHRIYTTV
jgi:hypothetical protein